MLRFVFLLSQNMKVGHTLKLVISKIEILTRRDFFMTIENQN